MKSQKETGLMPVEIIQSKIYLIRGFKVMFDKDLAELYEVPTKRLNEQVRRNIKRFPADFAFQLTLNETLKLNLRSQFATSRGTHGGRRSLPPEDPKPKGHFGFHIRERE